MPVNRCRDFALELYIDLPLDPSAAHHDTVGVWPCSRREYQIPTALLSSPREQVSHQSDDGSSYTLCMAGQICVTKTRLECVDDDCRFFVGSLLRNLSYSEEL